MSPIHKPYPERRHGAAPRADDAYLAALRSSDDPRAAGLLKLAEKRRAASSAPQALDVERLARGLLSVLDGGGAVDVDSMKEAMDYASSIAAAYAALAPSEPTETGETPGRQVRSWTFDEEHETRETDQP